MFKSSLIRVKAGEIIVIPITGTATITANKLIFGFIKNYHQSYTLKIKLEFWFIYFQLRGLQSHYHQGHKKRFVSNQLLQFHPNQNTLLLIHQDAF